MDNWGKKKQTVRGRVLIFLHPHDRSRCRYASDQSDYGHSHGVIGRTLMETAGEHAAILYNSADGRIVCVMLLANLSFSEKKCSAERPLRIIPVVRNCWSPSQDSHSGPLNVSWPWIEIHWPRIHYFLVRKKIQLNFSTQIPKQNDQGNQLQVQRREERGDDLNFSPVAWPFQ